MITSQYSCYYYITLYVNVSFVPRTIHTIFLVKYLAASPISGLKILAGSEMTKVSPIKFIYSIPRSPTGLDSLSELRLSHLIPPDFAHFIKIVVYIVFLLFRKLFCAFFCDTLIYYIDRISFLF